MVKIGISASFFHADPKRAIFKGMTLQYIEQNLAHWLMQRDVLAFMIPSPEGTTRRDRSRVTLEAYAAELDGLVLMGGSDVCPQTYGETARKPEWNGDAIRDEYEIGLLNAFIAHAKPVLGVCRGAQLINVAMGGTLYQDLATDLPYALNHRNWAIYADNCHATTLVPGTPLAGLYPGTTLVKTNSVHHQAIKGARAGTWSSRHGPSPIGSSRRFADPVPRLSVPCNGILNSTHPGDRSYIDDTPILDDFVATAARHKEAAYAL